MVRLQGCCVQKCLSNTVWPWSLLASEPQTKLKTTQLQIGRWKPVWEKSSYSIGNCPCSLLAPDSTRNRTTSRCPFWAAMESGVVPSSVVPWSLLAPDSTRNWTTSRCPWSAAAKRGAIPSSVVPWFVLAPDSTRNWTTSRCPLWAAVKRGVAPVSVLPWSLLAPDSTSNRTTSMCPSWAAMKSGVAPVSVLPWSLLAPDSSSNRTTSMCPSWAAMKAVLLLYQSCLGLCWHPTPAAIGQLQGALYELLWKAVLLLYQSCLGLCWHPTPAAIGQLQCAPPELLWKAVLLLYLSCLGLCWHRTPAAIGQLQGALYEQLWKAVLLHHLSCLGLCWHPTQPEIGQPQGAHSELLWKEALLLYLSCLGLCWHPTPPEIGQLQGALSQQLSKEALLQYPRGLCLFLPLLQVVEVRIGGFHWRLLQTRASLPLHLQSWDFVAGSGALKAVCHYFGDMQPWFGDLVPYQVAENPLSQALQLALQGFDHHPMGNRLGGDVVGIVEGQSAVPSAALTPLPRHLQAPLFQQPLSHQSLRKPLLLLGLTSRRISHVNHQSRWNFLKENSCLEPKRILGLLPKTSFYFSC